MSVAGSDIEEFLKQSGWTEGLTGITEVRISPHFVEVEYLLRNEEDNYYISPQTAEAATDTLSIGINWDE